jgi:hypothetical protein
MHVRACMKGKNKEKKKNPITISCPELFHVRESQMTWWIERNLRCVVRINCVDYFEKGIHFFFIIQINVYICLFHRVTLNVCQELIDEIQVNG